jgi:hypothetical protein
VTSPVMAWALSLYPNQSRSSASAPQDDPRLHDMNVEERVEKFVQECDKLFDVTRGDDIMLTMGTDFTVSQHPWHVS